MAWTELGILPLRKESSLGGLKSLAWFSSLGVDIYL